MKQLRVAILTHGGADRVLKKICELDSATVVGVFVETGIQRQRTLLERIKRSIFYDGWLETAKKGVSTIRNHPGEDQKVPRLMYEKPSDLKSVCSDFDVPYFEVDNYHSSETIELLKASDIDLGVIYGTNIIKETVFGIPKRGSINLHQGLAPYYRGGPPLFWELLNGEDEIGITVHYVASKVDSGDIILQETVPLGYDFSKYGLNYDGFIRERSQGLGETSARLVAHAVELISNGQERPVKQDLGVGKRYRLPSRREKNMLVATLKKRRDQEKTKNGSKKA
jgi:methionyl-tRNA formyltransferase